MTHKSKPNNAGFTNWQEILAGEDSLPKILWSENADLKFRASNGEDDDYKREHCLAQRRGTPTARDRGYSDHKHVQRRRQIILTITLLQERRFKKMPLIKFATKATRKGSAWSLQSKLSIGSRNNMICKVHGRNIFLKDWGQPSLYTMSNNGFYSCFFILLWTVKNTDSVWHAGKLYIYFYYIYFPRTIRS